MMRNTSGGSPMRSAYLDILNENPGISEIELVKKMHNIGFHNYTLTQARRAVDNHKRKRK